jgi:hypothetical protein
MRILLLERSEISAQNAHSLPFLDSSRHNSGKAIKFALWFVVIVLQDFKYQRPRRLPLCHLLPELQATLFHLSRIPHVFHIYISFDRLLGRLEAVHRLNQSLHAGRERTMEDLLKHRLGVALCLRFHCDLDTEFFLEHSLDVGALTLQTLSE